MPLETKFKKSILENQNYMAVGAVLSSCAHKFPVGRSPNFPGRGLSSNFPERKASPPSLYVQLKTRICTRVTSVASVHQRNRRNFAQILVLILQNRNLVIFMSSSLKIHCGTTCKLNECGRNSRNGLTKHLENIPESDRNKKVCKFKLSNSRSDFLECRLNLTYSPLSYRRNTFIQMIKVQ